MIDILEFEMEYDKYYKDMKIICMLPEKNWESFKDKADREQDIILELRNTEKYVLLGNFDVVDISGDKQYITQAYDTAELDTFMANEPVKNDGLVDYATCIEITLLVDHCIVTDEESEVAKRVL